ncbi:PREDICTED: osteopetrosis-associated transmembrane protein 1 [Nanorana parkeri]|uniref:osteopetrosis-associated transmembrane protein 1 n=1 Tax=Nanorana parkeri TaxID=125878 RepID=UPI0008542BEA|nr:PREDICTED: osteopetrosis-associated transmembrane protein 1 [Nanorana parkeri]
MMNVSGALSVCLLVCAACLGMGWQSVDPQSLDDSLMARSVWAEQLSLSLLPPYSLSPDHQLDPNVCIQLLHEFANNSADLSNCLASMAWPVRVCQHCYKEYAQLQDTWKTIRKPVQNTSTLTCATTLLRSDRVHVIVALYDFFEEVWTDSKCERCVNDTVVLDSTVEFMKLFDELMECFNSTEGPAVPGQHGNLSKVCQICNGSYKSLNDKYTELEHGDGLCIDLEDAMNSTRSLWSGVFNCTLPCTDTVPVIAVSAFILFLPVVFYLSSFLHSEQKKRKLIFPKRLKSNANLAHIQDKTN